MDGPSAVQNSARVKADQKPPVDCIISVGTLLSNLIRGLIVPQAEALKNMLVESDNVHRPRLDTAQLEADYGQDIVDYLLVSTCTRRYQSDDDEVELTVGPDRRFGCMPWR